MRKRVTISVARHCGLYGLRHTAAKNVALSLWCRAVDHSVRLDQRKN